MGKILCIGLNKTGTSSLHAALIHLGYRSFHWGGVEAYRAVLRAKSENHRLLYYVGEEYDAYSDIGSLTTHFELADEQYPGSKCILTTRNLENWLESRRRHVCRNIRNKERGTYKGAFLTIELNAWQRERELHHKKVFEYFEDRSDDLLVMDVCRGDGYEQLCPFLGKAVPGEPFPWANRIR